MLIASNFTGADVVLFGSVERDAQTVARRGGYDIVVTVTGPRETVITFRKERVAGIWVNADSRTFIKAPSYLTVLTNRTINDIADVEHAAAQRRPGSGARCCRRRSPATSRTRSAKIRSVRRSCASRRTSSSIAKWRTA